MEFTSSGRFLRTAALKHSWIEEVEDPEAVVAELKRRKAGADLFTFWQRYPDTEPRFSYRLEWDNWAVLPVTTYDDWFERKINRKARGAIRKAAKAGVEVRIVPLTDEFISGVTRIFNDTPYRQGRKFSHFGKDYEAVRAELSREAARTDFIGAYFKGELIGFIQQVYAKECAHPFGGLSLIAHRDKAANNAMLAKAVEACVARGAKYVVYGMFDYGTGGGAGLREFKIHHGFQRVLVPRYYVPLTLRGRLGLALRFHRGMKGLIPRRLLKPLTEARNRRNSRRAR